MELADRIRELTRGPDAEEHLAHYFRPGAFSGASFETLGGRGDAADVANRFTPADLVAITTLSVQLPGWGAIELLDRGEAEFTELLSAVPADLPLAEAEHHHLDPLWKLQDALDDVTGIGHVTRSKLLARKRPHLVPIRDQHVLTALVGRAYGPFTLSLRDALHQNEIVGRLEELRTCVDRPNLSLLRVLDIVVWMHAYGAASVE